MQNRSHNTAITVGSALLLLLLTFPAMTATLHVGAYSVSITPDQPVALAGQMQTRIAQEVESEVQANALALESRDGDMVLEQALFVACGLAYIPQDIYTGVRAALRTRIPDFDPSKLVINATHTHTAPTVIEGLYIIEDDDVMRPAVYVEFLIGRVADAAVAAWKARKPAKAGWGMPLWATTVVPSLKMVTHRCTGISTSTVFGALKDPRTMPWRCFFSGERATNLLLRR